MKMNLIWSEPASGCNVTVSSTAPILWLAGSPRWVKWANDQWLDLEWNGLGNGFCKVRDPIVWPMDRPWWACDHDVMQMQSNTNPINLVWIVTVSTRYGADWQMIGNNSTVHLSSFSKLGNNAFSSKLSNSEKSFSAKKAKTVADSRSFQYYWEEMAQKLGHSRQVNIISQAFWISQFSFQLCLVWWDRFLFSLLMFDS